MIRYERTQRTILVMCVQCGARDVFSHIGQAAADRWALEHVRVAHPGPSPAQERFFAAAAKRQRRRDTP